MLVFDQLKKNDPQLRLLALVMALGLAILLAGLWWVQIVQARGYRASVESQSYRTVRLPSVRGEILDRNGEVLAENRARYNISLYLEDLRGSFRKEYLRLRPMRTTTNAMAFWKRWLGVSEIRPVPARLTPEQSSNLVWDARCHVINQAVTQIAATLRDPTIRLDTNDFKQHYNTRRALPFPVVRDVTPAQIARFSEQLAGNIAADLEIQSTRVYPHGSTAAHVLGYLRRDNQPTEDEERDYYHRLPDFRGVVGIEGHFDTELRGQAGGKSVLVNSLGYRQSETILDPTEPGRNVVLTLDLRVQQAAERSLRTHAAPHGRGAVVVMDVHSGDVLALVSSPTSDPNYFVKGFPTNEIARWHDPLLGVQKNRATRELYQPGSTFKTVVALAALESGVDPNQKFRVQPDPYAASGGAFFIGNARWHDTAAPGDYDLRRAIVRSSNSYFITNGLRPGVFARVCELAGRLRLNERFDLPLMQESAGRFPTSQRLRTRWRPGDTANICIGQGELAVTPMQMAVLTAALANGGLVLKPRLVDRLVAQDPAALAPPTVFPTRQIRGELGVSPANLKLVRDAMLDETEHDEGTGQRAQVPGLRICGKTGTAEWVEKGVTRNTTWFVSFAPYHQPRHAVVVMVEDGISGGTSCAPVAADVYRALLQASNASTNRPLAHKP
jgi:penicillin-binding protein 2